MDSWFAVHTKPKAEAIADEHLRRQGFDCLLPRLSWVRRGAHGCQRRIEPMFPGYLFLRADPGERSLASVRSTRGAIGLVRFGGELACVSDGVIAGLRARMEGEDGLVMLAAPDFAPGQPVRVADGPLAGWQGVFVAGAGADRVRLMLAMLGLQRELMLPREHLAPCV